MCVIPWIHSYLSESSSYVTNDTSSSSRTPFPTGAPQGSVLGPLLFVLFISAISSVIQPSLELSNKNTTVSFHQYADDTQLHIGTNSSTLANQVATVESCTVWVNDWLLQNGLHLNPSQSLRCVRPQFQWYQMAYTTEIKSIQLHDSIVGLSQKIVSSSFAFTFTIRSHCFFNPRSKPLATLAESIQSIYVAGSPIKLQSSIKSLGVNLDSKMSFDKHVYEVCRASYFHIRALRHIRSSLITDAAKIVASAIVGSRLDYCNQAFIQDFGSGGKGWLNPGRVSSDLDPSPSQLGGQVSVVSSSSGVWGGAPAANDFGAF